MALSTYHDFTVYHLDVCETNAHSNPALPYLLLPLPVHQFYCGQMAGGNNHFNPGVLQAVDLVALSLHQTEPFARDNSHMARGVKI